MSEKKGNSIFQVIKNSIRQGKDVFKSSQYRNGVILLLMGALFVGWFISEMFQTSGQFSSEVQSRVETISEEPTIWTCSMHPQIQLPKPGKCPICAMDLIPLDGEVSGDSGLSSQRRFVMSPDAMKLAEIQTQAVERKLVTNEIKMIGKVEYDETQVAYITAWTGGRIDRLYIDQTGIPVKKGEHLASLYSPELLSAQEEYLQSLNNIREVKESHLDIIRSTSNDTAKNAREKLKLLGVTEEQIKELEERKVPNDHMTIYASASGIVVKRLVEEGDYVQTGTRIYSIVDLAQVWINLDAYESDLQWLRYGQAVTFEAEAYPGEIFKGQISLIHPILNEITRTVKVRVNVDNQKGLLKPGMFVRAKVKANVATSGKVMDTNLSGKWIGPMHPEIIRDEPGDCPICGMPLVSTDSLGYVATENDTLPLVVPVTAVLKTGERAVVYLRVANATKPTFEGREIVIGTRAGDYYLVKSGLKEGDVVVTQGNFKIDSALQIQAKPSMMSPVGETGEEGSDRSKIGQKNSDASDSLEMELKVVMAPVEFLKQLSSVYEAYFRLQDSLAKDDFKEAKKAILLFEESLKKPDMTLLEEPSHVKWMDLSQQMSNSLVLSKDSKNMNDLRRGGLKTLSEEILLLQKTFGHSQEEKHYEVFCPMALQGKGATWLQKNENVMNPFYGKMMLECGEVKQAFKSMNDESKNQQGGHEHGH